MLPTFRGFALALPQHISLNQIPNKAMGIHSITVCDLTWYRIQYIEDLTYTIHPNKQTYSIKKSSIETTEIILQSYTTCDNLMTVFAIFVVNVADMHTYGIEGI